MMSLVSNLNKNDIFIIAINIILLVDIMLL